ncbi:NAD-dependent epimerase/dehydratase family protein [Pedococcus bigeumensis]|uniref:NAD-dependent epimerase/dehydratase family protein n=1 Tax=Pedococcus bigeumensis TaxID=433644 RepID=A0A502D263_9MICO|nr:NAD-dependent epimerase/dehydratase family protein [Pedococcus bigeumensis]TPG19173.1 NAD-dependent epimerase/dehydratase family protein [Pedococcus bigeumensis]
MTSSSVLFIGGTGVISSACVAESVAQGHRVTILNRGTSTTHPPHPEAESLQADVRDAAAVRAAVGGRDFDVVVDFLSFIPDQVQQQLDEFADRTGQYVFISSASAYQTPPSRLPVTESTPLRNPFWAYSRNKIACEDLLVRGYRDDNLPMTIVRPSHTYDHTLPPFEGHWTVIERMRQGKPVVVHGDGTSLWTITHHTDFARAFVGLLGRREAIGEAFHITGDEAPAWNRIYTDIAEAAGVEPHLVHVPSDAIAAVDEEFGDSLLGDKTHSMVFDNTKIRTLVPGWTARVPFRQGAQEIVDWHDADPARRVGDERLDALYDDLVTRFRVDRA